MHLGSGLGGAAPENGHGAPVAEDGVQDGVVDVVVKGGVDRAQLDAAHERQLVVRLDVVHADLWFVWFVHGGVVRQEPNKRVKNTCGHEVANQT